MLLKFLDLFIGLESLSSFFLGDLSYRFFNYNLINEYLEVFLFIILIFISIIGFSKLRLMNIKKNAIAIMFIIFIYTLTLYKGILNNLNSISDFFFFFDILDGLYYRDLSWLSLWFSNIFIDLKIDSISIFFLLLTTLLTPLCLISSWNQFVYCFREFILVLFFIEIILFFFFTTNDLFYFYIFFECILIPLFLIIGSFGSRQRRIHASFQLFFFTLIGSFFMFVNIIFIYYYYGTTHFNMGLKLILCYDLEMMLWFFFFISFAVKVPIYPLHLWLPEAHVEAPTVGSVMLAGVILKMGTYGLLKFLIPNFLFSTWFFSVLVQILCAASVVYVSVITLCQIDLKKLIAYSSVAHMGFAVIGLFALNMVGISSSIFLMLNHGLVSSLLFFLIGIIYDRFKTRIFFYIKSLYRLTPILCLVFFFAMVANIGFPGTSSFIAEFLIMQSLVSFNKFTAFLKGIGILYSAFYSFWMFNRLCYGFYNKFSEKTSAFELELRELFYLMHLIILIVYFGLLPTYLVFDVLKESLYFEYILVCV